MPKFAKSSAAKAAAGTDAPAAAGTDAFPPFRINDAAMVSETRSFTSAIGSAPLGGCDWFSKMRKEKRAKKARKAAAAPAMTTDGLPSVTGPDADWSPVLSGGRKGYAAHYMVHLKKNCVFDSSDEDSDSDSDSDDSGDDGPNADADAYANTYPDARMYYAWPLEKQQEMARLLGVLDSPPGPLVMLKMNLRHCLGNSMYRLGRRVRWTITDIKALDAAPEGAVHSVVVPMTCLAPTRAAQDVINMYIALQRIFAAALALKRRRSAQARTRVVVDGVETYQQLDLNPLAHLNVITTARDIAMVMVDAIQDDVEGAGAGFSFEPFRLGMVAIDAICARGARHPDHFSTDSDVVGTLYPIDYRRAWATIGSGVPADVPASVMTSGASGTTITDADIRTAIGAFDRAISPVLCPLL